MCGVPQRWVASHRRESEVVIGRSVSSTTPSDIMIFKSINNYEHETRFLFIIYKIVGLEFRGSDRW